METPAQKPVRFKIKLALLLFRWVGRWPLGVARAVGAGVGRLMWWCQSREAKTTRINIAHCFPAQTAREQRALSRRSLRELGRSIFELPLTLQRPADWVQGKVVRVHNQALLDRALADPRGLLIVSPHLGNWEVVGFEVGRQSRMTTMYEPSRYTEMDQLVKQSRSKLGAQLVPTDKRGVLALIKALRAGGTVGILPDQEPTYNAGVFAPLFAMQALTMTLLSKLIQRANAQALIVTALRVKGGFELHYMEPDPALYDGDEQRSLAALNRSIERAVMMAPAQYQWEYKRFKRRPDGAAQLYP